MQQCVTHQISLALFVRSPFPLQNVIQEPSFPIVDPLVPRQTSDTTKALVRQRKIEARIVLHLQSLNAFAGRQEPQNDPPKRGGMCAAICMPFAWLSARGVPILFAMVCTHSTLFRVAAEGILRKPNLH